MATQEIYVRGATDTEAMSKVRVVASNAWFLVPGIGVQGGDLEAVVIAGLRSDQRQPSGGLQYDRRLEFDARGTFSRNLEPHGFELERRRPRVAQLRSRHGQTGH